MDTNTGNPIVGLIGLALIVFEIAAIWKIFVKAGEPGWASIVPLYNVWVLLRITGKPGWWVILMFVPVVNLVIAIVEAGALARVFGQGTGFAVGLFFLPFVFYPVLAWGDAQYGGGMPQTQTAAA